jgi:uncharacterized membrane protein
LSKRLTRLQTDHFQQIHVCLKNPISILLGYIEMILFLAIHVATGFTLAVLAIPLIQRSVQPNRWYGFRTKRTLADSDVWYDANAYMGKWLLFMGVSIIVAAVGLYIVPGLDEAWYALVLTVVVLVTTVLLIVQSYRYLHRIAPKD